MVDICEQITPAWLNTSLISQVDLPVGSSSKEWKPRHIRDNSKSMSCIGTCRHNEAWCN